MNLHQFMARMSADRWNRVKALFDAALSRLPDERSAFLADACGDDGGLRVEVETLLAAHEKSGSFLDGPAPDLTEETAEFTTGIRPAATSGLEGRTIGPYRIDRRIGAGGMGEVYRATDTRLGRPVAIKLLLPALASDAEVVRRFRQEPRAAAALNHPNICTVYDVGTWESRPFFAMEYMEGQTLRRQIGGRPLPFDDLITMACAMVEAVEAAHAKGIVHRDIKPANIFVTASGLVKVMDFGLAKRVARADSVSTSNTTLLTGGLTLPGTAVGTVAYMSPEQVRGEDLDTRSDLFSLGAVLYEMATGEQAFAGFASAVIVDAILQKTPERVSKLNPSAPPELEAIINKALEKNRDLRYQRAA